MRKHNFGRWYMDMMIKYEMKQAEDLAALIMSMRKPPSTVFDAGCGPGMYAARFRDLGCEVLGVDISEDAGELLKHGEFYTLDLTKPNPLMPHGFDLTICLEVGQLIRFEDHKQFVENIAQSSDTILFSSAAPQQGGMDHVAEADKHYWRAQFMLHGFDYHPNNDWLYSRLNQNPNYLPWLQNNAMLLKKTLAK